MSAYFIKKSYANSYKDRINNYAKNIEKTRGPNIYSKDEFISLRLIESTSSSAVYLRYHIESEKILIAKIYHNEEIFKLNHRETENYKSANFPFFPKFYGLISDKEEKSIIIEYVNGQTLNKFTKSKLSFRNKTMIIIEILYIFQYIHRKKFIYRDLKPNNLIVDENNYVILIDFDRMIKKDNIENHTIDLDSPFIAPEVVQHNYKPSFENDIYSIGKMIFYIFDINSKFQNKYPKTYEIAKRCLNEDLQKRPSLIELIKYFNTFMLCINNLSLKKNIEKRISILTLIDIYSCAVDEKDEESIEFLSYSYYEGKYIYEDIKKSLYYLLLGITQKESYYQYILGYIFNEEKYVNKDINKLKYYLLLAAEKNHPDAKYMLGNLYYNDDRINTDYKKAFDYFSQASELNHINAQVQLGSMYLLGLYVQKNTKKAIYYFELAADKKQITAYLYLFEIYYRGENVKQDINKAFYYLSMAALQNSSYAQNCLGVIYRDGIYITRDINKSIYYFTLSANQKDQNAQVNLGNLYLEGKYVEKDVNKAIEYFTLAAEQNCKVAENNLGYLYLNEKNFINIDKGLDYLIRSANKNYQIAQHHLGMIFYYSQYGIPRDINRALYYFTLSADQGYRDSQAQLGEIYFNNKDFAKSTHYLTLAAYQCDIHSMLTLGLIYLMGEYGPPNTEKFIYYLTLAADRNESNSQFLLGCIYYYGATGYIKQNIKKSIHYLSLSASQNHPDAQYLLGVIYYEGYYIKRDINKALKYMKMAAENYNINAQLFLGDLYFVGKYVKRNIEYAIKYYKEVSCYNNEFAKNNLGVIYKNGFNPAERSNDSAKIYFNEAIKQKNNCIAMFNLANILLDEDNQEDAIKLLIKSAYQEYVKSMALLGHIFAKKYENIDINIIKYEFAKYKKEYNDIVYDVYSLAHNIQITNNISTRKKYESDYILLRKMDVIYFHGNDIPLQFLEERNINNINEKQKVKDINEKFYEGLGYDIYSHVK